MVVFFPQTHRKKGIQLQVSPSEIPGMATKMANSEEVVKRITESEEHFICTTYSYILVTSHPSAHAGFSSRANWNLGLCLTWSTSNSRNEPYLQFETQSLKAFEDFGTQSPRKKIPSTQVTFEKTSHRLSKNHRDRVREVEGWPALVPWSGDATAATSASFASCIRHAQCTTGRKISLLCSFFGMVVWMGVDRLAKSASWLFELGMVGRSCKLCCEIWYGGNIFEKKGLK